jgi:hypothetical protein
MRLELRGTIPRVRQTIPTPTDAKELDAGMILDDE